MRPQRVLIGKIVFGLAALAAGVGTWKVSKLTSYQFLGEIIDRVETSQKVVALTFDDGPNPVNSRPLLRLLNKYGAKVTFFMVGKEIEQNFEIAKLVASNGHQLANHSYTHLRMIFHTAATLEQEIKRTDEAIRAVGFKDEIMFRAPYGQKMFALPYVLSKLNKKDILWDVESRDTANQDPEYLAGRVIKLVKPGSIVVFHEGGAPKPGTLEAVEKVLKALSAEGYRFVTVAQLMAYDGK